MPYLRQVFTPAESCISYFVCCPQQSVAVVVDPSAEWEGYSKMAEAEGARITHVIDTHIHADHLSGAKTLAEKTGAELCMGKGAGVRFPFTPLGEGEEVPVGNARLRVIPTPGHTTESVSLVYADLMRGGTPWGILTGDTLFVGDVGRLDLAGAGTYEQMYGSIFDRLLSFDDHVEVYPAHYAGSDCGSGARMSFKTVSTVGFEKRANPVLAAKSLDEFVEMMEKARHEFPPWFAEVKRANTLGTAAKPHAVHDHGD